MFPQYKLSSRYKACREGKDVNTKIRCAWLPIKNSRTREKKKATWRRRFAERRAVISYDAHRYQTLRDRLNTGLLHLYEVWNFAIWDETKEKNLLSVFASVRSNSNESEKIIRLTYGCFHVQITLVCQMRYKGSNFFIDILRNADGEKARRQEREQKEREDEEERPRL